MKKIALVSAIALVVLGCVLAAGCTSTTTQQTSSDNKIVGNWSFPYNDGNGVTGIGIDIVKNDGTGFFVLTTDDGKRLLKYDTFNWKKNTDGTYSFTFNNENKVAAITYNSSNDTFTDGNKGIHKRMDPVTGIWSAESKDENGKTVKTTVSLYTDGTENSCKLKEDGTAEICSATWTKNADGTYTIVKANGEKRLWKLDSTKEKATSSSGKTLSKKFTDSYYYLSILGPWYNEEKKKLAVFNADGTGIYKTSNSIENFTWTIPEFGKFKLHILDGEYKGNDYIWTYDRIKDTFYTPDGDETFIRPTKSIDGVTIINKESTSSDNKIVGNWTFPYDNGKGVTGTGIEVINKDGTGFFVLTTDDGKRLLKYDTFNWKKNTDGTYSFTFNNENKVAAITYNSSNDTITDGNKGIHKRLDPITGIWSGEGKDRNGINGKVTHTLLQDGTGYGCINREDGTTEVIFDTWKKNADGTYTVASTYGDTNIWTLDTTKGEAKSDSGRVFTKEFTDSYYYLSILGPWYDKTNKILTVFNADGTGIYKTEDYTENFTWTIPEFGKFKLHVLDGKYKGKDYIWTYDREKDTFHTPDGDETYVRPTGNVDGLTINKSTASSNTTTGKCPVVGTWVSTDAIVDGTKHTVFQTINPDGTGYWLCLGENPGIYITGFYKSSFNKTDWDGTFDKKSSDGNTYPITYDPKNNTLTETLSENVKTTYTKIDPIVGFWSGNTSKNNGGNSTTIFKPDGTGLIVVSFKDKGTAELSTLTWKKNTDGTYAINFSNGEKRTCTLAPSGTSLTSSSGTVKQKAFLDSTFLQSIPGIWYNKENNKLAVFNADGTGFYNDNLGIAQFNWKPTDTGKYSITYTSGKDEKGNNISGKTYNWSYNRENNTFTDGDGFTFSRVTESLKDKVTIS